MITRTIITLEFFSTHSYNYKLAKRRKTKMASASSLTSLIPPAPCNSLVNLTKPESMGDLVSQINGMKLNTQSEAGLGDPEKCVKHPLQNAWTLWFFKNDKSRTWEENQRPIITVTTVEDFWSLYNHIEVASRLPPGADYSLFKELQENDSLQNLE